MAKYDGVLPRTPYVRPKSEIYTTKRDDEHPRPFHLRSLPPQGPLAVFRANCLNLSLRAVALLKITPSSTGYTYSVASDNCLRLCPHMDESCAVKRSLSDGVYVYT